MTGNFFSWLADHGQDFTQIRLEACINRSKLCQLLSITPGTLRRWHRQNRYPGWAVLLVSVYAGYFIWPGWTGWKMGHDGKLYSPALRQGFTPGQIEAIFYLQQRCDHLERLNQAPAQYLMDL